MTLVESSRRFRFAAAAVLVLFAIWAAEFIHRSSFVAIDGQRYYALFDDAMISMRYAWNLSHGQGLVWNSGTRVEGYTSLLMTLLMALPTGILDKRTAVLAVQLFGIPTLIAIAILTAALGRLIHEREEPSHRSLVALASLVCVLGYYPLAYWTLMGMETGLETLLILLAIVLALLFGKTGGEKKRIGTSLAAGTAYLARPDAAVILLPVLLLAGVYAWRRAPRKGRALALLGSLGIFAAFPIAQAAFRFLYYGALVPNTYVLKVVAVPLATRVSNGLAFVSPFVHEMAIVLGTVFVGIVLESSAKRLTLGAMVVLAFAYQIWAGGDAWTYWRFLVPIIPMLFVLLCSEVVTIAASLMSTLQSQPVRDYLRRRRLIEAILSGPLERGWLRTLTIWAMVAAGTALVGLALLADRLGLGGGGFGYRQILVLAVGCVLLVQSVPCLVPTLAEGLRRGWSRGAPYLLATVLIAVGVSKADARFLGEMTFAEPAFDTLDYQKSVNVALALSQVTTPEASVGVTRAGSIPFFSGRVGVDFLGKSDEEIARRPPDLSGSFARFGMTTLPGHNKYDLDYSIRTLRPTYLQTCRWGLQDLCGWAASNYVDVQFMGVPLRLLADSPYVLWERLDR